MKKRKGIKKAINQIAVMAMVISLCPSLPRVEAESFEDDSVNVMIGKSGYKTEVFGNGVYDWESIDRKSKLPPSQVYLTDHYKEKIGTVPTSDWGSSIVFDKYSESLYVHPIVYRAASNGLQMAVPAVVDKKSYIDNEPYVQSLLEDNSVEIVVGGNGFTAKDAEVDNTTDWTYDVIMANDAGNSSMKVTLAKGSPYAFYKFNNIQPQISLGAGATDLAIYKNNSNSNQIGVSLLNKTDQKTHYYGIYAPVGTTFTNADGRLTVNLPEGKDYVSIAALPDESDAAFNDYAKYAYNFITDTIVDWKYNEGSSKITTTYQFKTINQETGAEGGDTIMALYPHQYRYAENENYTNYTYDTIRGKMKTIIGNHYTTKMTYHGILPTLVPSSEEGINTLKEQIGYYHYYYTVDNTADPRWMNQGDYQYGGYDTYWMGKNFNRLSEMILMSDALDDNDPELQEKTKDMVTGLKNQLEYWFDPYQSWNQSDSVFYYHKDYGTMIGYPASFGSDFEVNDHHFHYGYWIKAAATVALMDNTNVWEQEYGGLVYELIDDIANMNRDGRSHNNIKGLTDTKYPFMRNFDIYEGHSWASGVANYEFDENGNMLDPQGGLSGGDNQESSTESINAWASLILWGEAVGDKEIRDLGVYLYTTEVASIEDYYFDVHDEIFTDSYEDRENHNIQMVTRLWGGKYDHTAWWTEDPIEVTTISMLPMTGATLFLGKYPEKVKAVYESIRPGSKQWEDYINDIEGIKERYNKGMETNPNLHQDILAEYYALYDPEAAMTSWNMNDDGYIEFGDSRPHTYAYIRTMMDLGTPNFEITGSSPFSMVFEKNGKKSYVAFNYSNEKETVYFSDGTYIDVEPGRSYIGDKTGDGVNPNAGEEELPVTETTYTIQYELNGGSVSDTLPAGYKQGEEVNIPTPIRDGYEFKGWYLDADFQTEFYATSNLNQNITLYAKWETRQINVTNIIIKEENPVVNVNGNIVLTLTVEPENATNKAIVWTSSNNAIAEVNPSTGIITGKQEGTVMITATATDGSNITGTCIVTVKSVEENNDQSVEKTYTVVYDSVGGSYVESQIVKEGEKVRKPQVPVRDGFTFKGWMNGDLEYDFDKVVTDNLILTASWEVNQSNPSNDDSDKNDSTNKIDDGNQTSQDNTGNSSNGNSNGNGDNVSSADSNNAGMNQSNETGTSQSNNAGTDQLNETGTNQSNNEGTSQSNDAGTNQSNDAGMSQSNDAGTNQSNDTGISQLNNNDTNVSLNENSKSLVYVIYNTNGGSVIEPMTFEVGKIAVQPADPIKKGYVFAGWMDQNGNDYLFNTKLTKDTILTAKWLEIKVSNIEITGISKKIAVNKRIQLNEEVEPESAFNTNVIWTSSNTRYATVDENGLVKVKNAGKNKTVIISATAADGSGVTATYKIKIMPKPVKKIVLKADTTVKAGKKVKIKATVTPSNKKNTNTTLIWSSNNTKYATVNKKGVVTTKNAGKGKKVKITAKATDGSNKKKSITIRIK